MTKRQQALGFSLIEMLIAVALVGVLAAVAYPQYETFLKQNRRADAMTELSNLIMEMEQYRSPRNSYLGAAAGGGDTGAINETLLMELDDDVSKFYTITIKSASRSTFELEAKPIGSQADDSCGTITVGNNGYFNYSSGTATECIE